MSRNLTNLYISQSFEYLVQVSGSEFETGLGSTITSVNITASNAVSASFAVSSSNSATSISSSYSSVALSSSFATSAQNATTANSATNATSASFAVTASYALNATVNTASLLTTASAVNNVITFTKGDSSQFTVTVATGSAVTVNTGSLLVTASISNATTTFTKGDGSTFSLTANNVVNATYAQNTITTGKNLHNTTIALGTPLYFTGSGTSGNLVGIYPADAGNPNRMPAGGIAGESIAVGAEGIVLLDGYISGVNTSTFASGDEVFVAVGGGYTNSAPTGSALIQHLGNVEKSAVNGSGVIQMMGEARALPNIQQNYVWLGDSNGVPQAVVSSSLVVTNATSASFAVSSSNSATSISSSYSLTSTSSSFATSAQTATSASFATNATSAATASFLPSNTNLNVASISASTAVFQSASIGYLQTITGSVVNIGDSFIVLNTSDVTRYAGIKVEDSGSSTPQNYTASFQFDSQTNDWFYEYSGSDPTNFGVAMFGPEYNTIGSPTYLTNNRLSKGNGGHHLNDSTITDNGTNVTFTTPIAGTEISASTGFLGNLTGTASFATSASYAPSSPAFPFTGSAGISGSLILNGQIITGEPGNTATGVDSAVIGGGSSGNNTVTGVNSVIAGGQINTINTNQSFVGGGRNCRITGGDRSGMVGGFDNLISNGDAPFIGGGGANLITGNYGGILAGTSNTLGGNRSAIIGGDTNTIGAFSQTVIIGGKNITAAADNTVYVPNLVITGSLTASNATTFVQNTTDTYTSSAAIQQVVTLTQAEYNAISGSANVNTLYVISDSVAINPAAYATTGSNTFNGNQIISGSLTVTGSTTLQSTIITGSLRGNVSALSISSNTASLNCSTNNFFTLTLVSGSNTFINPTNIAAGQTINLRITQANPGNGTVSFPSSVKQVSGSSYVPSTGAGPQDIVTFISFDASSLYLSNVKNLV
jgi:hypothetical protein